MAAGVVGAVVIVQTVAKADASKKSGFFVSSSEQKKLAKKAFLLERAKSIWAHLTHLAYYFRRMSAAALFHCPSLNNRPFRMPNSLVDMECLLVQGGDRVIDTIERCVWNRNSYVAYVEMWC